MARHQLAQITGLKPDTVSGIFRDDAGWHITVEIVELERIPACSDVLATYESVLDSEGTLLSYDRVHRYSRGQTTEA
jgi:hypothetical protein